jgi:hypothetical protein
MGERDGRDPGALVIGTYRPLLRVRGSVSLPVCPCGPVHTWLMHWCVVDSRTVPCVLTGCPHCADFSQRRPLSYLAVQHYVVRDGHLLWLPAILEVPLSTGIELADMRGLKVGLKRMTPRGKVIIGTFSTPVDPPRIEPFNILPSLFRLWRLPTNTPLRLVDPPEWSMWAVAHG